jgi:hypothetical protein
MAFYDMPAEQRAEYLAAAHKKRADTAAFNKENEHLYKLDYLDMPHWSELASKYKVRMPTYNEPASAKGIRKAMKKCCIDNETFKAHYTGIDYFLENNAKWTMAAVTGLILELKEGCYGH